MVSAFPVGSERRDGDSKLGSNDAGEVDLVRTQAAERTRNPPARAVVNSGVGGAGMPALQRPRLPLTCGRAGITPARVYPSPLDLGAAGRSTDREQSPSKDDHPPLFRPDGDYPIGVGQGLRLDTRPDLTDSITGGCEQGDGICPGITTPVCDEDPK